MIRENTRSFVISPDFPLRHDSIVSEIFQASVKPT